MRIGPVGGVLLQAGGQREKETDMTKLIVASGNSANAPKNQFTTFRPRPSAKSKG